MRGGNSHSGIISQTNASREKEYLEKISAQTFETPHDAKIAGKQDEQIDTHDGERFDPITQPRCARIRADLCNIRLAESEEIGMYDQHQQHGDNSQQLEIRLSESSHFILI